MKKIGRVVKYIALIPFRILYLPRIYRRLVILEEHDQRWMQTSESLQESLQESRHECYIAETMLKALAANLRDFAQIKAKQDVLESRNDLNQKNLEQVKIHEAELSAAIRDLTQDVKRLKEILAAGTAENDRKDK